MQQLQQALLLKKLYLLKSMDFHYCDVYFKKPTQKSFQSNNAKDLHSSIQACQLCSQKLSKPHTGLCNPNSKITFISTIPILDTQLRFASKGAQMLKKIIENVFELHLNEVSILSLLKCEIPQTTQKDAIENCFGYLLKQLEFSHTQTIVILGETTYNHFTKDKTPYKNIQGKILTWNHYTLFPTFSLMQLLTNQSLKAQAHREFLTLKGYLCK
ncbi:uracil-DNA glycosylase family protein [Helicobacter pullorum]|uniref:uracil-DNA glycosylase family protein n=1 Tax=Helicobacter pullorum TaxID=35818 RepID=UPI001D827F8F|nr:uracil-DNA glycosylase family protein [Helicobacter pullorum]HJF82790.1 uracil-DNA glycosylase [Helicobacter pullorum]